MTLMLGVLGTFFYLKATGVEVHEYGWIPLLSFVTFVLGFSAGFGPIPWLMMGEILPGMYRVIIYVSGAVAMEVRCD